MLDAFTSDGMIRRWSLVEGKPECLLDAIPPDDPEAGFALAQRDVIDTLHAEATALAIALAVRPPTNGEPETVITEDGEPALNPAYGPAPRKTEDGEPNTAWDSWDDAQAVIAAVSPIAAMLARVRAGEAQEGDDEAVQTALEAVEVDLAWTRAAKRAETMVKLDQVFAAGFSYDFGGPHGVQTLQTRDIEDRTNWLISQAAYMQAVGAGMGALPGANFRTLTNDTVTVTFLKGLEVLNAMSEWGAAAMARSWALKDAIAAASSVAELEALDVNAGWP